MHLSFGPIGWALGLGLGLLSLGGQGCSGGGASSGGTPKCIPGAAAACVCAGGASGGQVCAGDGTYGACICDGSVIVGADASAGGGDGAAGTNPGDGAPGSGPAAGDAGHLADGAIAPETGTEGGTAVDSGPPFNGCDPNTTEGVDGNQYIVQTDEWNSTLPQCLSVSGTGFTVTEANFDLPPGPPATYPSIYKGCHWSNCTDPATSGMPVAVSTLGPAGSGLGTVTSSWNTSQPGTGTYDVAYDIWFNQTATTVGQPNGAELMIWISEMGVLPGQTPVGTVSLAGVNWQIWEMPMASWTYVAYQRIPTTTSVTDLDVGAFIADAVTRGIISPSWYLIDVEAGFEIWQGGQGLATNSFSVDVSPASGTGCSPQSCGGCCSGATCETGSDPGACGTSGGQCTVCGSSDTCSGGVCVGGVGGTCPIAGETAAMIDDGSGGASATSASAGIVTQCGRVGGWYTFQDPSTTQFPAGGDDVPRSTLSPPNGVPGYIETYGTLSNEESYGAGLGFDFYAPAGTPENYDATGYTGISFWMIAFENPAAQPAILFQVLDDVTAPLENGAYYFGAQLTNPPEGVWVKYSYTWAELGPMVYLDELSLDLSALRAIQWQFDGTAPGSFEAQPFDIAIGDVEFTR